MDRLPVAPLTRWSVSPGACGQGRCVNAPGGFTCYCPFGKTGARCDRDIVITEPSFGGDSYLAFDTPRAIRS